MMRTFQLGRASSEVDTQRVTRCIVQFDSQCVALVLVLSVMVFHVNLMHLMSGTKLLEALRLSTQFSLRGQGDQQWTGDM